jgi:Polysaccharide deacetylase
MKSFVVALVLCCMAMRTLAVSNDGRIPILTYHTWMHSGCEYANNAIKALESDLETLHARGWTVVPLSWVAEWVVGDRDRSTLPDKAVAITFDDGPNHDVLDSDVCGYLPGGLSVLQEFKKTHPDLPTYSPQVTMFVIASPLARLHIGNLRDDWWWYCQNASNGICVVGNHSADHDTPSIWVQAWDPDLLTDLRIGSIIDGSWNRRTGDFTRINSESTAHAEVYSAALFISGKTGMWPELFAYPFGQASDYLRLEYFPKNIEHQTYAAFCKSGKAATRNSDRYCIPRFVYGEDWKTHEDFLLILAEPKKSLPRKPPKVPA